MKETSSGLVRYRGRLISPGYAQLLKANIHHQKARKYAPKGVDPATISPCLADVQRLGPGIRTPEGQELARQIKELLAQGET
jgi:hypothetical protein